MNIKAHPRALNVALKTYDLLVLPPWDVHVDVQAAVHWHSSLARRHCWGCWYVSGFLILRWGQRGKKMYVLGSFFALKYKIFTLNCKCNKEERSTMCFLKYNKVSFWFLQEIIQNVVHLWVKTIIVSLYIFSGCCFFFSILTIIVLSLRLYVFICHGSR